MENKDKSPLEEILSEISGGRSAFPIAKHFVLVTLPSLCYAGKRKMPQMKLGRRRFVMKNRAIESEKKETRIAIIGIIVSDTEASERINELLHQYSQYVVGRMGIPYREKGVSVISVVVDASEDVIGALSGKLGMVKGISTKTIYSKA